MKQKILTKYLVREAPLIAIECWHTGRVLECKKLFGFEHPATIFIHRNNTFEFYTDKEEFQHDLALHLSQWIQNHPTKLHIVNDRMVKALQAFNKKDNENDIELLMTRLTLVTSLFTKGYLGVLITHHLPIFDENFKKKGQRIFDESVVEEVVTWRKNVGNVFFSTGIETILNILKNITHQMNWDEQLLRNITLEELTTAIKNNELPIQKLSQRAKSTYVYCNHNIIFEPSIDAEIKKAGYKLEKEQENISLKNINGTIAFKGCATGTVNIIFNRNQLNTFQEGEILVAPMTCAWYEPIMKKAAAIITDEGGITCHAAILARELNKPCIIGTKISTKTLNNGDLIEVDANKGIITKK